ncbi:MAG: hypothetical protein WCB85_01205 [Candidatus Dormiibacterota bacterium]
MTALAPPTVPRDVAAAGDLELPGRAAAVFRERHGGLGPNLPRSAVPPQVLARDQAEVEELGLRLLALLGREGRSRTWLGSGAAGELRVARRLPAGSRGDLGAEVTDLVRLVALREPSLLTPTQLLGGDPTWVVRRFSEGVALRRLLTVVGLSSAQVAALAHDLIAATLALHAAGLAHGSVHGGNVIVGIDGWARLCDAATSPRQDPAVAMGQDIEDLSGVLEAALARRSGSGRRRAPEASGLAHLEAVLGGFIAARRLPTGGLELLLTDLDSASGGPTTAVRRQLSALVDRVQPRAAVPAGQQGHRPTR